MFCSVNARVASNLSKASIRTEDAAPSGLLCRQTSSNASETKYFLPQPRLA